MYKKKALPALKMATALKLLGYSSSWWIISTKCFCFEKTMIGLPKDTFPQRRHTCLFTGQLVLVTYLQSYSFGSHKCAHENNASASHTRHALWKVLLFLSVAVYVCWATNLLQVMLFWLMLKWNLNMKLDRLRCCDSNFSPRFPIPFVFPADVYFPESRDRPLKWYFGMRCVTFIAVIWGFPARRLVKHTCATLGWLLPLKSAAVNPHLCNLPHPWTTSVQRKQPGAQLFPQRRLLFQSVSKEIQGGIFQPSLCQHLDHSKSCTIVFWYLKIIVLSIPNK